MAHPGKITKYSLLQNKTLSNYYYSSIVEKPISSVYNIYFNKEKSINNSGKSPNNNSSSCRQIKTPLYNRTFFSPRKKNKRINYKILFPKSNIIKSQRNNCSIEYSLSYITSPNREEMNSFQNSNIIHPDVYIRKNNIAISQIRSSSQNNLINEIKNRNKAGLAFLTLTPNNNDYHYDKKDKNMIKSKSNSINTDNNCDSQMNNNHNIININLYNEKNNYIENNIINKIYMNKNRKNNSNDKINNASLNKSSRNTIKNESDILTERRFIPRRTNYSFYYSTNNHNHNYNNNNKNIKRNNKIINRTLNKGMIMMKKNSKKKINYLPKVERNTTKKYNLASVIKIQSIMRGYLLNKKLDKYLRDYARLNEGIKILEKKYKRYLFDILKNIKQSKKYCKTSDILCHNNRNNIKNDKKNMELQLKINELINEKKELQNNYQNLKEFINKHKELEKENQDLKQEIIKLKQKNNKLLFQLQKNEYINYNKYKKYIIQKQNDINIISSHINDLIFAKYNSGKKYDKSEFFTLGSEGKDNEEQHKNEKNETLKINSLRNLFKNLEKNYKYNLYKNFIRFYYNGKYNEKYNTLNNQNSFTDMRQISVFNRRYKNENQSIQNNINNVFNGMSIKTLSDNSSSMLTKENV
jgi:hypothetical protein